MNQNAHFDLCVRGATWLRQKGFGVVAMELSTYASQERADVIGFRSTASVVIEAKTSRADFFADAKKPHRTGPGLGNYRFFLCPTGLITPDELPKGWGLLYAGRKVELVHGARGNTWPSRAEIVKSERLASMWLSFYHDVDVATEQRVLYSIARRLPLADQPQKRMSNAE